MRQVYDVVFLSKTSQLINIQCIIQTRQHILKLTGLVLLDLYNY